MRTRRDLGHNAAKRRVILFLAQNSLGQDAPIGGQHRRGRFITGRLETQYRAVQHISHLSLGLPQ